MAIWGPDRMPTSRTSEDWANHTFYEDSDYPQKVYQTEQTAPIVVELIERYGSRQ